MFAIADTSKDNLISKQELLELRLSACHNINFVANNDDEFLSINEARSYLHSQFNSVDVDSDTQIIEDILNKIDADHNGYITRKEMKDYIDSEILVEARNVFI